MKWIIFLILIFLSCITSNTTSVYDITYIDGCYYIITSQGGITAKVNQPAACKE